MINLLKKHIFVTISVFSLFLIAIPITFFLVQFGHNKISNDITVWASFADYISGTVNIILSLSSLIILGLLTHNIGKQSNEENKKTNILLRRLDSYELLAKYLTEFELVQIKGRVDLDKVKASDEYSANILFNKMEERISVYFELYALLQTYPNRFGHLFKYDFNSKKYHELVCDAEVVKDLFRKVISTNNSEDFSLTPSEFNKGYEKLFYSFGSFLKDLANELK